jgi:hypothetical protein
MNLTSRGTSSPHCGGPEHGSPRRGKDAVDSLIEPHVEGVPGGSGACLQNRSRPGRLGKAFQG